MVLRDAPVQRMATMVTTTIVLKTDADTVKTLAAEVKHMADMAQDANNLKQIGLAIHNYHDNLGAFPSRAFTSKDGKPLLSWRVAILPFIEEGPLYEQFKLDEPWDKGKTTRSYWRRCPRYSPRLLGRPRSRGEPISRLWSDQGTLFNPKVPRAARPSARPDHGSDHRRNLRTPPYGGRGLEGGAVDAGRTTSPSIPSSCPNWAASFPMVFTRSWPMARCIISNATSSRTCCGR